MKGRIFDIQRFSLHDGPGIRTIVFLKGCLLRCAWCCNPESQSRAIETLMEQGVPRTVGRDVSVEDVMKVILRDQPYYRRSGGGVTLSGGEALCQPDFALALLRACRAEGIHRAIETTAAVAYETIQRALPLLDTVLLDIKHMDSTKHKAFTGQPNERILENARRMAPYAAQLVVRVPVIPGFNNTPGEILDIARFARHLSGVREIHLLPYHRLGQDKYAGLGRDFPMGDETPPSQETMEDLRKAVETTGLLCQIGG